MNKKSGIILFISSILVLILILLIWADLTTNFDNWFYNGTANYINSYLTSIVILITNLGATTMVTILSLILLSIPEIRFKYGIPAASSVIVATFANVGLKSIFMRERPDVLRLISINDFSFPSGHAMVNAALYSMLSILVYKLVKSKKRKTLLISLYIFITLLIGLSRVYLGVHYITDVIGGWLLGLIISIIIYNIFRVKQKKKTV